jgi:glutamate synthase (NADPH/NADH) large chain
LCPNNSEYFATKTLVFLTFCIIFALKIETKERFNKDHMTKSKLNGLYQPQYEHDACGVGMVVNIHGGKSHELVDQALRVLENMEHRGAETRDKTGDGAGIMLQIPHEFILLQGIPVPEKGKYGTGLVFLPKEEKAQQEILSVMIEEMSARACS